MIAIIHFHPIEIFPPAMNDVTYLGDTLDCNLTVYTTSASKSIEKFKVEPNKVRIMRFGSFSLSNNLLMRYINYFIFYFQTTLHLLYYKPKTIFYFETISFLPVFIYKIILKFSCRVFIHYHEYTSPSEYKNGAKLNRWLHKLENQIYPMAMWISHTNSERMQLFISDIKTTKPINSYILPNYPPKNWYVNNQRLISFPIKMVYVGALSMDTMFTKEFAKWVIKQEGKVYWDIYSRNISDDVISFIKSLNTKFITLQKPVTYTSLKKILENYDLGVILYKGHIPNYIFNAPNKLFEYHACGLDVWFPYSILGSIDYCSTFTYPKVMAIDFMNLESFNYSEAICRTGFKYQSMNLFCEDILETLRLKLLQIK